MKILFALPGFHRYDRGAETALIAIARELAESGNNVTLIGSGESRPGTPYRFIRVPSLRRERFERLPSLPVVRDETKYEEASFALPLWLAYRPQDYDVTLSCSYPFVNWVLRGKRHHGVRPPHVFITQNGDWPATSDDAEYSRFGCEGLVCTNPDYFARNKERWPSVLIANSVNTEKFCPGPGGRAGLKISADAKVVLMVSALIASKHVAEGVKAVAAIPGVFLVIAGDGPLRSDIDALAMQLMPGRFQRLTVAASEMPDLYRAADAFLHLSKVESFGNVYIEAMACGLPIVSHDDPRQRWIVGDHEYLVDSENTLELDRALRRALDEDPACRERRVARAQNFAAPTIAARYHDFLSEVVERVSAKHP